jgi:hypothetical protein
VSGMAPMCVSLACVWLTQWIRYRTEVYVGSSHVAAASKDGKGLVYLDVNVLDFLL